MLKLMVLDDHIAVGEGTRAIIQAELQCEVEVFTEPLEALDKVKLGSYDVYLIDFHVPNMNGLTFIELLLELHAEAIVIIYTGHQIEQHLLTLWQKGIVGFVSKTASRKQLIDTILYALEGKLIIEQTLLMKLLDQKQVVSQLTKREKQILLYVQDGLTNKAIAAEMHLSQRSIEKSLTLIFSKLQVESRVEAVMKWNEMNSK